MTDANVPKMVSLRTPRKKQDCRMNVCASYVLMERLYICVQAVKYLVNLKKLEEYLDVGKGVK